MKSSSVVVACITGALLHCLVLSGFLLVGAAEDKEGEASLREENFDRQPPNWEGINNRNTHFSSQTVVQDFGYSPSTAHVGGQPGEIGGVIHPAGEPAYYGFRLPNTLTLDDPLIASGTIFVARGAGHFLLGCFNADTLNEWRTRNTMAARINGRGNGIPLPLGVLHDPVALRGRSDWHYRARR